MAPLKRGFLNIFVEDDTGAVYRVCFWGPEGREETKVMLVVRRNHAGHDVGRPLSIHCGKGRALVAKALVVVAQRREQRDA